MKMSDQIREAIRNSGMSRYRINKLTGWDRPAMNRFLASKQSMTVDTLDRVAEALGLELVKRQTPAAEGGTDGGDVVGR